MAGRCHGGSICGAEGPPPKLHRFPSSKSVAQVRSLFGDPSLDLRCAIFWADIKTYQSQPQNGPPFAWKTRILDPMRYSFIGVFEVGAPEHENQVQDFSDFCK